jgi:hypothetical protein
VIHRANRLLDGTDPKVQKQARKAVAEASSLLDAVERAGLLEGLGDAEKVEARAALTALPKTVDTALLAVLKGALRRRLPVVIQWKPGPNTELHVWEAVEGDVGHVGVTLTTPYARDLAAGG